MHARIKIEKIYFQSFMAVKIRCRRTISVTRIIDEIYESYYACRLGFVVKIQLKFFLVQRVSTNFDIHLDANCAELEFYTIFVSGFHNFYLI